MRVVTAALVLTLCACGTGGAHGAPRSSLAIDYWPHGRGAAGVRHWMLRCAPPGGTHPRARVACAELAAHPGALTPARRVCPLLIRRGAPETRVTGSVGGRRVALIARPGCPPEWSALHALLTAR